MKKLFCILMVIVLAVTFCGCAKKVSDKPDKPLIGIAMCSLHVERWYKDREAFLEEKRNQESKGLYCTSIIDGYQDFIFCNRFGEVLNLGVINKALRRIVRDCNEQVLDNHEGDDMPLLLPRFSCHTFRHTFTTRMCESGMNVKVVQDVLGHSDIRTTLDVYTHITKELQDMAMDDLSRYLEEKKIS